MTKAQHIVVVDDEEKAREVVGDYLRMHGFSVTLCDGGSSLRAAIGGQLPDLIVLDLNMPEEDGLSIVRDLKRGADLFSGVALVGLPLALDDQVFNCAAVIQQGRLLGLVPKSFIPNYKEFYEGRWFAAAATARSRDAVVLGFARRELRRVLLEGRHDLDPRRRDEELRVATLDHDALPEAQLRRRVARVLACPARRVRARRG